MKIAPCVRKSATKTSPPSRLDRVEQREEVARELLVLVDRHPAHDVGQRHAPEQGRHERAPEDRLVPLRLPARLGPLVAVLEAEVAHDERDEDEQERQVETAEQRCVPVREGGEGGTTRGEHPHLVAVPDRADGVDEQPPALLGVDGVSGVALAAEHGQEHADTEVEALEHEVARPQDAQHDEPEGREIHGGRPLSRRRRGEHPRRGRRGPAAPRRARRPCGRSAGRA